MSTLQKIAMYALIIVMVILGFLMICAIVESRSTTHDNIVAVAEDLGCKLIEQSYYHPENFYVDCGSDGVQIITVGKQ
jgi:hypothetical protein